MLRRKAALLLAAILFACSPAVALAGYDHASNNAHYDQSRDDRGHHDGGNEHSRGNQNFYHGVREGGHGGDYDGRRSDHHGDDHYGDDHRGGIGPGKAALIGGAGGAVLGAVLGGGLKGSLVGGAAGAGIGAVVGAATQDHRRH